MPGPLYFARAVRLSAYQGVMAGRVRDLVEGGQATTPQAAPAQAHRPADVPEGVWLAQHSDWIDYD
jgi:hypothetical protein